MIITYPDVPWVKGTLTPPRPLVFLLGSFELPPADLWRNEMAQKIDPYAECVMYGVCPDLSDLGAFLKWETFWLERADIIAFWVEDCKFGSGQIIYPEFELGFMLGNPSCALPVIGVGQNSSDVHFVMDAIFRALGVAFHIHRHRDDMTTDIISQCRSLRHEPDHETARNRRRDAAKN